MIKRVGTISFLLVTCILAGCGAMAAPEAAKPSRTPAEIVEEWMYLGKATVGFSVSPKGSAMLCSTIRPQEKGSFEEAWDFYAGKCGSDLKYKADTKRLIGVEKDGDQYTILDYDSTLGRRETSFARRAADHLVSVTLVEIKDKGLSISVTVGLR